jgi:alkylation response protein AidB-like acyl-CoA dehydrogenase
MTWAKTPGLIGKQGLSLVSPTLMDNGSEFLKKRFIAKALSGEELWCQGFSEPNAGSDVANQETFAEKKGDSWVINGQKVWTSFWENADWMICITRTDRSHKHKGLTYFCVPVKSEIGKSVEVRPLINVAGGADFAEEFLKDLTVHDDYVIDGVGQGWAVAMTTLKHERGQGQFVEPVSGGMSTATKVESEGNKGAAPDPPLISLAKTAMRNGKPAAEDPVIRDRIMQLLIREKGFDQSNRRTAVKGLVDHPMRVPMQFKLVNSEIAQDQAALSIDIQGISANLQDPRNRGLMAGSWASMYVGSFGMTIAAGTSEIQRNQLGERVLGLPKSR